MNRINEADRAHERMAETIARLGRQIAASKAFIGPQLRLVVLPEYFLTGFPMGETIETWAAKACIDMEGPEYQAMSDLCRQHGVYLSGNVYELDPHFPGLYFQASFIIDDSGEIILRYRRLISMFAPTPHDVLDRYVEVYGVQRSLFPRCRYTAWKIGCRCLRGNPLSGDHPRSSPAWSRGHFVIHRARSAAPAPRRSR